MLVHFTLRLPWENRLNYSVELFKHHISLIIKMNYLNYLLDFTYYSSRYLY